MLSKLKFFKMNRIKERLERARWLFADNYAYLEIYTRDEDGLLYDPKKDEVRLVYGPGITPYKPDELDIELLCQDFKVKPFIPENKVKRKMIYAHFYGHNKDETESQ